MSFQSTLKNATCWQAFMAVSKLTLAKSTALLTEAAALLSCSHRRLCTNGSCWIPCRGRQYLEEGIIHIGITSIETCNLSCWIVQKFDFSRNHCRGNPRGVHCRRYTSLWSDSFHHENPLPIAWSMELQSHPPGCKLTHLIYHWSFDMDPICVIFTLVRSGKHTKHTLTPLRI